MTFKNEILTTYQPYTSLMAIGAKKFETRSWNTHYRGKLGLHAAKTKSIDFLTASLNYNLSEDARAFAKEADLAAHDAFSRASDIFPLWVTRDVIRPGNETGYLQQIPKGALIAVADLVDVWVIGDSFVRDGQLRIPLTSSGRAINFEIMGDEILFGEYLKWFYAWELENVEIYPEPIVMSGKQGLWNYDGYTGDYTFGQTMIPVEQKKEN